MVGIGLLNLLHLKLCKCLLISLKADKHEVPLLLLNGNLKIPDVTYFLFYHDLEAIRLFLNPRTVCHSYCI